MLRIRLFSGPSTGKEPRRNSTRRIRPNRGVEIDERLGAKRYNVVTQF